VISVILDALVYKRTSPAHVPASANPPSFTCEHTSGHVPQSSSVRGYMRAEDPAR
jgi:hypothetical protein